MSVYKKLSPFTIVDSNLPIILILSLLTNNYDNIFSSSEQTYHFAIQIEIFNFFVDNRSRYVQTYCNQFEAFLSQINR